MDEGFDDWELVCQMFWEMGIGHLTNHIEATPTRLGPPAPHNNGRKRALKVELRNERIVEQVLNSKYELRRSGNFYQVYINNDLNKVEREKEMQARKIKRGNKFANAAQGAAGGQQTRRGEGGGIARRGEGGTDVRKREVGNNNTHSADNNIGTNSGGSTEGVNNSDNRSTEGAYGLPPPNRIQGSKSVKNKPLCPKNLFSDVAASTSVATRTAVARGTAANMLISTPGRILAAIASPMTLLRSALYGGEPDVIVSNLVVNEEAVTEEIVVNEEAVTEEISHSKNGAWGGESKEA